MSGLTSRSVLKLSLHDASSPLEIDIPDDQTHTRHSAAMYLEWATISHPEAATVSWL